MSKLLDLINNQIDNKESALNNALNGKPIAAAEFSMDNKTILKLGGAILAIGLLLMLMFRFFIQRK